LVSPGNTLGNLLRDADAAARAGDRSEAERLYRRVLDRSPANVAAWLGLGTVLAEPARKAECFEKVLELDPGNADAAASLDRLRSVLPVAGEKLYCAFHPKVETVLRCSQCGRPICVRCVHPHAVGQLCPICVRERRPLYYQIRLLPLLAAGGVSLLLAALLGWGATYLVAFGIIPAVFGGALAGSLIGQVALRAGQRRRGIGVQLTMGVCILLGTIAGGAALSMDHIVFFLIYGVIAIGVAVAWLK
jgi:tetratricopeptide (TPR) repeat protein